MSDKLSDFLFYQEHGVDIYCGDCLEIMPLLEEKSIDLIVNDPPYNIGKSKEWDKWKKKQDYLDWYGEWLLGCQRLLRDNGSFYFFHNYMPTVARLMIWIEEKTEFVFKQFMVWNKRFEGSPNKGYMDGYVGVNELRNYQQLAEYLLFYTFQDETELTTVTLDTNNFPTLRKYFRDFQDALAISKKTLIEIINQNADHCFRWNSPQWRFLTKETYKMICELPLKKPFLRREYEDLRREYENLRYTFNNQKTHHSVWNYDFAEKIGHITPKPLPFIKNILKHSSNEDDTVFDGFAGSFTTAVACRELNRKFIGIEKKSDYCKLGVERLKQGSFF